MANDARNKLNILKAASLVENRLKAKAGNKLGELFNVAISQGFTTSNVQLPPQSKLSSVRQQQSPTKRPVSSRLGYGNTMAGMSGRMKQRLQNNRRNNPRFNAGGGSLASRLGFGAKGAAAERNLRNKQPRFGQTKFQNFKVVADVTDEDNLVFVQSANELPGRRVNRQNAAGVRHNGSAVNANLSRTIRNDFVQKPAASRAVRGGSRGITSLPNRQHRKLKSRRGGAQSSQLFQSALTDVARSRSETRETAKKPPVLSRLASTPLKLDLSGRNGYKVKVTNLSSTVTEEDVEELFSSIGPLRGAHLMGRGSGEALFVRLQDAKRAISEFNNRELDGVAMKCALVATEKEQPRMEVEEEDEEEMDMEYDDEEMPSGSSSFTNTPNSSFVKTLKQKRADKSGIEIDRELVSQALFRQNEPGKSDVGRASNAKSSAVQFTVKI